MGTAAALILSVAAVIVAALAWDFGRRWLAHRSAQLAGATRLDRFERELADHKETHAKAIANLLKEVREEVNAAKTKASLALESTRGNHRRIG